MGTCLPAPRMGLQQGDSVRLIDDFSFFGHNATSSTIESPATGGVDEISAVVKTFMHAVCTMKIARSEGQQGVEETRVCEEYRAVAEGAAVGRTLDLEKAYTTWQHPPCPASRPFLVVVVWHPKRKRVVFYRLLAMPFGARNSVFSFAGFGCALQWICCVLFWLPSSEYVDDYTQIALRADKRASSWMERVLMLLGWELQEDPRKTRDFAPTSPALGVVFNCEEVRRGYFSVEDTAGRVEGILGDLSQAARSKACFRPP